MSDPSLPDSALIVECFIGNRYIFLHKKSFYIHRYMFDVVFIILNAM